MGPGNSTFLAFWLLQSSYISKERELAYRLSWYMMDINIPTNPLWHVGIRRPLEHMIFLDYHGKSDNVQDFGFFFYFFRFILWLTLIEANPITLFPPPVCYTWYIRSWSSKVISFNKISRKKMDDGSLACYLMTIADLLVLTRDFWI